MTYESSLDAIGAKQRSLWLAHSVSHVATANLLVYSEAEVNVCCHVLIFGRLSIWKEVDSTVHVTWSYAFWELTLVTFGMKKNQHYSFIQRSGVVMRLMNAIKQWKVWYYSFIRNTVQTLHSVTGPMQKVGQSRLQLSFKLPPEALTIVLNEIIQVGQNLPTKTRD